MNTRSLVNLFRRIASNPDFVWGVITANGAAILNIVVQIVMVPLYLATLGKGMFGLLMILLAIFNYLGVGLGWASAGVQRILGEHWARNQRDDFNRCYLFAKFIYLGYAALACAAGALAVSLIGLDRLGFDASGPGALFLIVGGYLLFAYDVNVDRLAFNATGRQAYGNGLAAAAQAVFVAVAVPGLLSGLGFTAVFGGLLAGQAIARLVGGILLMRQGVTLRGGAVGSHASLRRAFGRMGVDYAIYAFLLMGLLQGDILMLGWLGDATVVAEFVLVWKIADVAIQFLWRIPESLVPSLVKMDVDADYRSLHETRQDIDRIMIAAGLLAGVAFAVCGQWMVELWVGAENAPDDPWAFVAAGAAIVWLTVYRTSAIFAYSLVRLGRLNLTLAAELLIKMLAIILLFDYVGYMAPIIAISLFHGLGGAIAYRRAADRALKDATGDPE